MKKVLLINGPNLNMLGKREPDIYGHTTLEDIVSSCKKHAATIGMEIIDFQSNHEGAIVDKIQQLGIDVDGIIINAAAYTHTSIAIRDALCAVAKPVIEVHLSNIYEREKFRHHSYITDIAEDNIVGKGAQGYIIAIDKLNKLLTSNDEATSAN